LGRVKKAEEGFIVSLILSDINEIPSSICTLKKLQELEIYDCKIEKYPEICPNLMSLKRIKFKNNTIDKIPHWVR
jgi:Leucine-rich repeat (LRR) protein